MTNTAGCLKRFFTEKIQDNPESDNWRKFVTDFLGCTNQNFRRWFRSEHPPEGEHLLRVRVLCELMGYCPIELAQLDVDIQIVARLIAFKIVDFAEVTKVLDLSKGRDALLDLLLGRNGTSKDRLARLTEFAKGYQATLTSRQEQWRRKLPSLPRDEPAVVAVKPPVVSVRENLPTNGHLVLDKVKVVEMLAAQVKAMLPLAQLVVSDQFSAVERKLLRSLTANGLSHGVFDLSTYLSRLCGEEARGLC